MAFGKGSMKKILKNILLLILGAILAFVFGEALLRARGVLSLGKAHQYDSKTGMVILPPNSDFIQTQCLEEPVLIHANSEGFRDAEFEIEKSDDVFRIAVLGDSYTEARHVPLEKSFHGVLEEKLNQELGGKKKFEVYSFGMGGSGTYKNYLYLTHYALKYKPDLVILAFLPLNDFRDDYEMISEIYDKNGNIKSKLSTKDKLFRRSVLLTWLNYKWQIIKQHGLDQKIKQIFVERNSTAQIPFDFQVFLKDYPESWQKVWNLEKNLISAFQEAADQNNSKFMIVTMADAWRIHPDLIKGIDLFDFLFDNQELDLDKPEKILGGFAQEKNIPFLNLTPVFRQKVEEERKITVLWPCDAHWNQTGHAWGGEALFNFLKEKRENLLE